MPADDKMRSLIQLLKERTESRALTWEKTPAENEYRASLKSALVRVKKDEGAFGGMVFAGGGAGGGRFSLAVTGPNGEVVEEYAPIVPGEHELIAELFILARRSALKFDQVLDGLLQELNAKTVQ